MTLATAIEVVTAHGAGHDSHGGHDHSDHPAPSTGLDSRKMLMWVFLTSDCMFFGTLIATYMTYRNRSIELQMPPYPNEIFDIPYTSVSAFVLLMSSLTMVLALAAIQRGNHRGLRIWISATALLGAIFVGGQFFEFTTFAHEGLTLSSNIFGSSFYVLTGFHGAHVTIGVIWLISLLVVSLRGGLPAEKAMDVEIAGLYWHFVDIVWIVIFTLVYLVPYGNPEGTVVEESHEAFIRFTTLGERLMAALPF
jgi:heme/copper-type cytochrome/quinol oxidase subunit 3